MAIDAAQYAVTEVTKLDELMRRNEGYSHISNAVVTLGGAGVIYGGFLLYRLMGDSRDSLISAFGGTTEEQAVDAFVLSKRGGELLHGIWTRKYGPLRAQGIRIKWEFAKSRSNIKDDEANIQPGVGVALVGGLMGLKTDLKEWEQELIDSGYIPKPGPGEDLGVKGLHPIDRAAMFVLDNKWFWAGAFVLAFGPYAKYSVDRGLKLFER